MCSFSIILTFLHSFPVLFCVLSTAIIKFPLCTAILILNNFCISSQIIRISMLILRARIPIPFLAFQPLFSTFPSFLYPIPYFGYFRQPAQFVIFKNLFQENNCFSSKTGTPLHTTPLPLAPNYLLHNQCYHQKLFTLQCLE